MKKEKNTDDFKGLNYYHGFGRAVDYDKAFENFELGAQKGNPKSQRMLGIINNASFSFFLFFIITFSLLFSYCFCLFIVAC